ncbi:hypothetical protein [Brevirhabdus sp.]|uniref:hypothetical protein n=1 Tax=Brevirhabdus sp. TaxID=2004514 RepID=UPI0040598B5B
MGRKRKLSAEPAPEAVEEGADQGRLGGFWGGSALNMLKARLEETQSTVSAGVMNGTIALQLSPDQIVDEVGTDRVKGWEDDPQFAALKKDMERRGQKQAIRVRPADPDWRPGEADPLHSDARFVIQSGRRRLEALRQLGRPVNAVISTDIGDAALADLEERFKENTMRQNLTGFEELLSIGLLAESYKDLSQAEIAERLNVPPGDVSLGLACLEMNGEIILLVDVANTPKREFRQIIPRIRAGKNPQPDRFPSVTKPKSATRSTGSSRKGVSYKASKSGFTLKFNGFKRSEEELERLSKFVLSYLEDQDKTKES